MIQDDLLAPLEVLTWQDHRALSVHCCDTKKRENDAEVKRYYEGKLLWYMHQHVRSVNRQDCEPLSKMHHLIVRKKAKGQLLTSSVP